MLLNTAFNNISAISWWSDLLMGKTEYPAKTIVLPQVNDKCYYIKLYRVHLLQWQQALICTGSGKSNYHTITTSTVIHFVFYLYIQMQIIIVLYKKMFLFWTGISTYGNKSMKNKTPRCLISFKFYQKNRRKRAKIDTPNIHRHECPLSQLNRGNSIKSGRATLVLWVQASPLIEMMRSCLQK